MHASESCLLLIKIKWPGTYRIPRKEPGLARKIEERLFFNLVVHSDLQWKRNLLESPQNRRFVDRWVSNLTQLFNTRTKLLFIKSLRWLSLSSVHPRNFDTDSVTLITDISFCELVLGDWLLSAVDEFHQLSENFKKSQVLAWIFVTEPTRAHIHSSSFALMNSTWSVEHFVSAKVEFGRTLVISRKWWKVSSLSELINSHSWWRT